MHCYDKNCFSLVNFKEHIYGLGQNYCNYLILHQALDICYLVTLGHEIIFS